MTYTLQLHADPDEPGGTSMGEHVAVGPDRSGNKYTLVTTRSYLQYENAGTDTDNDSDTTGTATSLTDGQDEYVRQRIDTVPNVEADPATHGVQAAADIVR